MSSPLPSFLAALAVAGLAGGTTAADSSPGLVVEEVTEGSAGDRAGLKAGDLLLGWSRLPRPGEPAPVEGNLATPFDLTSVEETQVPLANVTLTVERNGKRMAIELGRGEWGLRTHPSLSPAVLARYKAGRSRSQRAVRAREWRAAAEEARRREDTDAARWLFSTSARAWAEAGQRAAAEADLRGAMALARGAEERIQALEARGRALQPLVEAIDEVEAALKEALRLRQELDGDGLGTAASLESVGLWVGNRGDISASEGFLLRSLSIREALAPGSLVQARVLCHLSRVPYARSEWDASAALLQRALAIAEPLEPQGGVVASALIGLGNVNLHQGPAGVAESYYRRALALRERVAPFSLEVCRATVNLGVAARNRGDAGTADELNERAYRCFTEADPNPRWLGGVLGARGVSAMERGQNEAARTLLQRALEITERLSPSTSTFGLRTLADLELRTGRPAEARRYLEKSFAIEEKDYRDTLWRAETLALLGEAARMQGDLEAARAYLERALASQTKVAPDGLSTSHSLQSLGEVAHAAGQALQAKELYEAALAIRRSLAPGSYMEADSLHRLALLARDAGHDAEAAGLLRLAIEAVENHATRIGGAQEARSSFRVRHGAVHRDLIEVLLATGRNDEALHVLERARARVLLEQLAERDLSLSEGVPPELERERREIHAQYDGTQAKLQGLSPLEQRQEVDRLLEVLRDLQRRRGLLADRMRAASPRQATLRYPQPLDAAGIAQALDPGTVLVSYLVGPEKTRLFVLDGGSPSSLAVYTVPMGAEAVGQRVAAFRRRISQPVASGTRALRAEGRALFALLLGPAEDRIAKAERILLSPDGPLHALPFAALVRGKTYLAEWKPMHSVVSATVYAELRRSRPATGRGGSPRLAAFGDPQPHPQHRRELPPLPATRREVASVESLFAGRSSAYLGSAATEARAVAVGRDVAYLHFACHARLDERFPLDSSLMLSPGPGEENGLLQAWEIFERMRLDAELVTLSACNTALGADMGGEGLMGLTRAFLFAGARSVVASLWSVSDRTTGELMKRFYGHLTRGEPKDRALRAAQLEMIRAGDGRAHPFRWAAFQVFGDWR